jgi:hypothetical protein
VSALAELYLLAGSRPLEEARRYMAETRSRPVGSAVISVPTRTVLALGIESAPYLARLAADAARDALADVRAGRPLRTGSGSTGMGYVAVKFSLPLDEMRELREAVRRNGRRLSEVVCAYLEPRALLLPAGHVR